MYIIKDIISKMEPVPTQQILSCDQNSQWSLHAFFMEDSAIHNTVVIVLSICVLETFFVKAVARGTDPYP